MIRCQYELLELHTEYDKHGHLVGTRVRPGGLCQSQPVKNTDWCTEHAYVHELLQAAQAVGYPAMAIASAYNWKTQKQEPVLAVGKGLDSWLAYASRHPRSRHKSLMKMLAEMKRQQDLEAQNAIKRAVEKNRQNAA